MHASMELAGDVLYVRAEGEMDLPRALRLYRRMLEAWRTTDASRILIDCTAVGGRLTDVERYEAGTRLAASYAEVRGWGGVPPRIAVVAVPPLFDRRRFLETVASNRGALLSVFESVEEAASWLDFDPATLTGKAAPLDWPEP